MNPKVAAILSAVLAAVFYAVNMPASKRLLEVVPPTMMAALLYLGAGIGIGLMYLAGRNKPDIAGQQKLTKADLPYTVGMIVLDILAPVALMLGLARTTSANASLLNNFEIAATSIAALVLFREAVSGKLWLAIALVTLSSSILSFEDMSSLTFSRGSLLVLLAAVCWGLENNCTRMIASKNTYEIVALKGICSGLGSLVIALSLGERLPAAEYIVPALALGFVAYGLSIFFYIKAQNILGAARTSAYYAVAPFVGAFLSFLFLREALTVQYALALLVMACGSLLAVTDTLEESHTHLHTHLITHTHDGTTHSHIVEHSHRHSHLLHSDQHTHSHRAIHAH